MDYKAVIFDLNGVFIQSPSLSKRVESDYKVSVDTFLPVLSQIMDKVRKPNAPDIYVDWKPHLEEWNISLSRTQFLNYWFSAEKEDKEMIMYARTLKEKGWKIFVLSNNFRERTDYYKKNFSFFNDLFNKKYISWQTGNVKPDEKCFIQILEENDLMPNNCYYFDDSEKNVDAAKKLGIRAHKYSGLDATKNILKDM
ncbi:MAG: HAD-IA family hydrolase [Candidatus Nanoarchaeia archaeon]